MTPAEPNALPRAAGPWVATAVVIGTVIGSGVFKKPQAVAAAVPDFASVVLVWVAGGLLALLGALVLAEIATRLPRAGGNYAYLRHGFGPLAGFLWGWVEFWVIRSASIAALASVVADSLHDILCAARGLPPGTELADSTGRALAACALIAGLAWVNARGLRWGGGLQVAVTGAKVGTLILLPLLPFAVLWLSSEPREVPRWDRLDPLLSAAGVSWTGLGAAMVAVLWAYHGWMNVGPIAEEVRDPARNVPRAVIGGVLVIIVLYLGANLAYALVIPRPETAALSGTTTVAEFGRRLLGPVGALFGAAAVALSAFGSLNGNLLVGPRLLFAMGRDGLLPRRLGLGSVDAARGVPVAATALLAGWSALLVIGSDFVTRVRLPALEVAGVTLDPNVPAGKPLFDVLTDFSMFGAIAFETLAIGVLFVMRRRGGPPEAGAYRCPGYPLVPAAYCAVMLLVLANMFRAQSAEALVGVSFVLIGCAAYRMTRPSRNAGAPDPSGRADLPPLGKSRHE